MALEIARYPSVSHPVSHTADTHICIRVSYTVPTPPRQVWWAHLAAETLLLLLLLSPLVHHPWVLHQLLQGLGAVPDAAGLAEVQEVLLLEVREVQREVQVAGGQQVLSQGALVLLAHAHVVPPYHALAVHGDVVHVSLQQAALGLPAAAGAAPQVCDARDGVVGVMAAGGRGQRVSAAAAGGGGGGLVTPAAGAREGGAGCGVVHVMTGGDAGVGAAELEAGAAGGQWVTAAAVALVEVVPAVMVALVSGSLPASGPWLRYGAVAGVAGCQVAMLCVTGSAAPRAVQGWQQEDEAGQKCDSVCDRMCDQEQYYQC
jgi:hypothetical protein